ncbi:hypothetical protein [Nocardia macrotermitis]|uniref:Uncharacterized protein n=1 Tax=Nocardia macrotermitis TaxID=2585198 RepID=A0A7K0D868_9NOCA|nr:hypothetical protein [Nocardia macrotermitis]MQY21917.1 hypothetical protein [Nocardia macrotermitis]
MSRTVAHARARAGHAENIELPSAVPSPARPIAWSTDKVGPRPPGGRASVAGRYAIVVVMLVVGVAMLAAGCAGGTGSDVAQPSTTTVRQLEAVPPPDPSTPDGVAVAALKEIYTWYPATESEGSSLARARRYLGPTLLRTLDSPPSVAETPKPSLQWADWGRAGAKIEAFAFASGEKAPSTGDPDHQQYKIGIEQTAVYPDGRRESLPSTTVIATVVSTGGVWRLDGFR